MNLPSGLSGAFGPGPSDKARYVTPAAALST